MVETNIDWHIGKSFQIQHKYRLVDTELSAFPTTLKSELKFFQNWKMSVSLILYLPIK